MAKSTWQEFDQWQQDADAVDCGEAPETAELRCQCGQTIGGKTGRTCPLPRGARCEHLVRPSTRGV